MANPRSPFLGNGSMHPFIHALKLKTAQYQLAGIYIKEQTEYIQNQIDKIRDSVEDRQSRIAWQTINEVSRRKNTAKAKLKAANQQERIKLWKQHFENLLGNPPKITHEPITRIISKQLDIKLGPFTQEELDSVLRKIKNRKAAGLDEILPEVWKTRQFDDILLRHCNAVYNQNSNIRSRNFCHVIKKNLRILIKKQHQQTKTNNFYICKQSLMMSYEGSESARENLNYFSSGNVLLQHKYSAIARFSREA